MREGEKMNFDLDNQRIKKYLLMDAVNWDKDVISYCQAPDRDLYDDGEKLFKKFDTRNKFIHFERQRITIYSKGYGNDFSEL